MRTQLHCCLAGCLVLACTVSPVVRGQPKPPAVKLAPPSAEEQARAEKNIKSILKGDFGKVKSLTDKSDLAQKLLQLAVEEKDDTTARFVLFRLALDLAAQAGNQKTAYEAVDEMAVHYEVEPLSLKKDALMTIAKTQSVAAPAKELLLTILKSVDEATAAERFDAATSLAKLAESSARLTKDSALSAKANAAANKIQEMLKESESGKSALELLRTKPDDPVANLAVGKYLSLVKGDWPKALPLLTKGTDPKLKTLAEQDLSNPSAAAQQLSLADRWWDLAGGESGAWKTCLQRRASEWYQKCLPMLTGLKKAKAEKRVAEVSPLDGDARPVVPGSSASAKNLAERKAENPPEKKAVMRAPEHKALNLPPLASSLAFKAHSGTPYTVAFSHDGRRILTSSGDKDDSNLRVWDAVTGKETLAINETDIVYCAIFSSNDKLIVAGTWGGMIRVWDADTGKEKLAIQANKSVRCVALSPDGKRIVSGSGGYNGAPSDLRVWDGTTGQQLMANSEDGRIILGVAFSPDGKHFVTAGGFDKLVKVWNASTFQVTHSFAGHTLGANSVDFSRDGRRIVSGSYDKMIKVWDVPSGREVQSMGPNPASRNPVFSPDGKYIIAGGLQPADVQIWDAFTGQQIRTLKGSPNNAVVWGLSISPDGTRVAAGSTDRMVRVWDLVDGKPANPGEKKAPGNVGSERADNLTANGTPLLIRAHSGQVLSVAFSPDGKRILSGSGRMGNSNTLRVSDATTGKELLNLNAGDLVFCAAFSPDGKLIVSSAMMDGAVRVWDADTGQKKLSIPVDKSVVGVAFSPDSKQIVGVGGAPNGTSGNLWIWDAANGQVLASYSELPRNLICVAFSPDGTRLVTGGNIRLLSIWNASTARTTRAMAGHPATHSVEFSGDGKRILSAGADQTIRVWDSASGQELLRIGPTAASRRAVFSPDSKQIISGGGKPGELKVWDARTGQEILTLKAEADIYSVAACADGKRVAAGLGDGRIQVWDLDVWK